MEKNIQDEDFQWFLDNYDDLYRLHGHKFLAIKNKKVIGIYDSLAEGVHKTDLREEPGTFIVQECNGDESGYTTKVPSLSMYEV